MNFVFGPIVSRRFGYSLGIDLSPNEKSCNFDCIYCELEKAKTTTFIKNPPLVEDVILEVEKKITRNPSIDIITITSNGEPTLFKELEILVNELNRIKEDKKILILSNGSTIMDKNIQKILKKIDIVKLSLDTVNPKTFKKIDRPDKNIKIEDIINGIEEFKKDFKNELVIEILIVKGINDKIEEMKQLNLILNQIEPDRVDLGTIDRPPAYRVESVSIKKLEELAKNFHNLPLNIIYNRDYKKEKIRLNREEILETLKMRPLSKEDIDFSFDDESKKLFEELKRENRIEEIERAGIKFYRI